MNKNHEKALAALLETSTVSEAAEKANLSPATLYRYLTDADFQKEYRKARRALVESSIGQIQSATGEAVETLRKNLTCENPQAEIRAAQIILDVAFKGIELLDVLQRLEILEEANELETKN